MISFSLVSSLLKLLINSVCTSTAPIAIEPGNYSPFASFKERGGAKEKMSISSILMFADAG